MVQVPFGGDMDAHSRTNSVAVELLADRSELVEAVTDLRWREWGHAPEPTDWRLWRAATIRESGRGELTITWVASDSSGALGAVGLGQFDIEELHDRSPWLLGMIVRPDRRRSGLGRLLLNSLESWASEHGYGQLWVADEGPNQRCGWQFCETVERGTKATVTVLNRRLK